MEYDGKKDVKFYDYNGGGCRILSAGDVMVLT